MIDNYSEDNKLLNWIKDTNIEYLSKSKNNKLIKQIEFNKNAGFDTNMYYYHNGKKERKKSKSIIFTTYATKLFLI